jgi:O-antigen/teichoic acid export membrane protein
MPQAPTLPSLTDLFIGAAVLFGTVGCVIIFRILYRKWKSRIYRHTFRPITYAKEKFDRIRQTDACGKD